MAFSPHQVFSKTLICSVRQCTECYRQQFYWCCPFQWYQTFLGCSLCPTQQKIRHDNCFSSQIPNDDVGRCVEIALDAGYRLIDTATGYGNEKGIGEVLKKRFHSGSLKRGDVFITSKVNCDAKVSESLNLECTKLKLLVLVKAWWISVYIIIHIYHVIWGHCESISVPSIITRSKFWDWVEGES